MTTDTRQASQPETLTKRHAKVLDELKRVTKAHALTPAAELLRRMAAARFQQAGIYREAATNHHVDSIEWHALIEAAFLLEHHAEIHLAYAADGTGEEGNA